MRMLSDMNTILVIVVTIVGALVSATLGWIDSGEDFVGRKFASSIIHAILAAIIFAVGSYTTLASIGTWDFFVAFLGGAGIDVLGNRLEGFVSTKSKTAIPAAPAQTPPM